MIDVLGCHAVFGYNLWLSMLWPWHPGIQVFFSYCKRNFSLLICEMEIRTAAWSFRDRSVNATRSTVRRLFAELCDVDQVELTRDFCAQLQRTIQRSPDTRGRCSLIHFDGA